MRLLITTLAVLFTLPVVAHHSTLGIFDKENIVEIEGVVTEARWRNPHASYKVEVTNDDGSKVEWDVETGSISTLRLRGVDADMAHVGDRVRFAGESSRRGLPEMFAMNVLLSDGREVLLTARSAPRWPEGMAGNLYRAAVDDSIAEQARRTADGIFRVWSTVFNDRDSFPLYGDGVGPLTAEAEAQRERFDPLTSPYLGCDPRGMPYLMTNPYPFEFTSRGEDIVLHTELYDAERIIHMNAAPSSNTPYSRLGYSRGRWEGSTLIVETDRIDAPYLYGDGTPQSQEIHLLERFALNEAQNRLDYTLTVTDPETFPQPVTFTRYWAWRPEVRREPYNCQE
jgi:hypothetical protein